MSTTEISQDILDLSAKFKEAITLDKKTGVGSVPADTYVKTLPEGITEEILVTIQNHNAVVVPAMAHALGHLSIPVMSKNKELEVTTLHLPTVGKDAFNGVFTRERQIPSRGADGIHGVKPAFGSSRVSLDIYSTGSHGEFKKVKAELAELAAKAFGG